MPPLCLAPFDGSVEGNWDCRGLSGKESTCQCRRHRFDPWVGKIPQRRKWQPTSVFLPGKSMDRGVWWATVQGHKESDTME